MLSVFRFLILFFASLFFWESAFSQTVITGTSTTGGPAIPNGGCTGSHTGFPFRICAQGSYVLGGNISAGAEPPILVEIPASNVTLDLNGFTLKGSGTTCTPNASSPYGNSCTAAPGSDFGIYALGSSVHIKNGAVTNFNGTGVLLGGDGSTIDNVTVRSCGGDGFDLFQGLGRNLTSEANVGVGISTQGGRVESSFSSFNNLDGFELLSQQGQIVNSHASYNKGNGFYVGGTLIDNVTSTLNNGTGLTVQNTAHVLNSSFISNTSAGVSFPTGTVGDVINTSSTGNGTYGFALSSSTCYLNVMTSGNASGSISGGAAFVSGVCAH